MKRPLTTSFSAPAPREEHQPEVEIPTVPFWREVAPIVAALLTTLEAFETGPKAGPTMKDYRSALRRQGEAAAALGGPEAIEAVLHQVAEADPKRAEQRLAFVRDAWAELPRELSMIAALGFMVCAAMRAQMAYVHGLNGPLVTGIYTNSAIRLGLAGMVCFVAAKAVR